MRRHLAVPISCLLFIVACGKAPAPAPVVDAGKAVASLCDIAASGVTLSPSNMPLSDQGDTLMCSGTVNGAELQCNDADPVTMTRTDCSDGYVFAMTSGATNLYIRVKSDGMMWSCGAKFTGGDALVGNITFQNLGSPEQIPHATGDELAAFYLNGTMDNQAIVASGTLTTTW